MGGLKNKVGDSKLKSGDSKIKKIDQSRLKNTDLGTVGTVGTQN